MKIEDIRKNYVINQSPVERSYYNYSLFFPGNVELFQIFSFCDFVKCKGIESL